MNKNVLLALLVVAVVVIVAYFALSSQSHAPDYDDVDQHMDDAAVDDSENSDDGMSEEVDETPPAVSTGVSAQSNAEIDSALAEFFGEADAEADAAVADDEGEAVDGLTDNDTTNLYE